MSPALKITAGGRCGARAFHGLIVTPVAGAVVLTAGDGDDVVSLILGHAEALDLAAALLPPGCRIVPDHTGTVAPAAAGVSANRETKITRGTS